MVNPVRLPGFLARPGELGLYAPAPACGTGFHCPSIDAGTFGHARQSLTRTKNRPWLPALKGTMPLGLLAVVEHLHSHAGTGPHNANIHPAEATAVAKNVRE